MVGLISSCTPGTRIVQVDDTTTQTIQLRKETKNYPVWIKVNGERIPATATLKELGFYRDTLK
jgi:hypothetical protein